MALRKYALLLPPCGTTVRKAFIASVPALGQVLCEINDRKFIEEEGIEGSVRIISYAIEVCSNT